MPYYVISMILSVPLSLSATEQSTLSKSPVSSMTLPPVSSSSDEPTGIGASLTKNVVPLVAAQPPPDVVDTSSTSVVT